MGMRLTFKAMDSKMLITVVNTSTPLIFWLIIRPFHLILPCYAH